MNTKGGKQRLNIWLYSYNETERCHWNLFTQNCQESKCMCFWGGTFMCFFKNTVGNKASMAPKCPVMGADFSKMETNCFPFLAAVSFHFVAEDGMVWKVEAGRSFSRKWISVMVLHMMRAESGVTVSSHRSDLAFFGPAPFLQRAKKWSVSIKCISFGIWQASIVHFEMETNSHIRWRDRPLCCRFGRRAIFTGFCKQYIKT